MKRYIYKLIFFKILGWKISGELPNLNKYIFVVAPHTSNWDFFIGVFVRGILGFKSNFLAKKSLFKWPLGVFFKWMGGHSVDRTKKTKLVDQVIEIFNNNEEFRLAIAPEGTRKNVTEWKTGFYHIAVGAKIPILPVAFDWEHKEIRIKDLYYPTGDFEREFEEIKSIFRGVKGKV
jgi:1-acyl-sn-glycerol-3-phosphate acyltransferase